MQALCNNRKKAGVTIGRKKRIPRTTPLVETRESYQSSNRYQALRKVNFAAAVQGLSSCGWSFRETDHIHKFRET